MRAKPDPWSPPARVTAVEAEKRTSVEGNRTSEQGVIGVTQRSLENRPRPPRTEGAVDRAELSQLLCPVSRVAETVPGPWVFPAPRRAGVGGVTLLTVGSETGGAGTPGHPDLQCQGTVSAGDGAHSPPRPSAEEPQPSWPRAGLVLSPRPSLCAQRRVLEPPLPAAREGLWDGAGSGASPGPPVCCSPHLRHGRSLLCCVLVQPRLP